MLCQLADRHQMYSKLNAITKLSRFISASEFQVKMNRWDNELTNYMRAAETKYRKYNQNNIDLSPEVGVWIRCKRLLVRICNFLEGKVRDPHNLFRACVSHQVSDPRTMTLDQAKAEHFICIKKLEELNLKAPGMRHKHLQGRLDLDRKREDEKAAADILRIMHREYNSKRWRRVKRSSKTKKDQGSRGCMLLCTGETPRHHRGI